MHRPYNVLFLCTGNSARSILAEALLAKIAPEKFRSFSAGSQPKGRVHPEALALLQRIGFDTAAFRSKSWDEYAKEPHFDFIFTVCDNAAHEVCPAWPGKPMTAHWGLPDPAAVEGSAEKIQRAFRDTLIALENRIRIFTDLPFDKLDRLALKQRLDDIGAGQHAG
jgi:protein-tyrosine-phosphatase